MTGTTFQREFGQIDSPTVVGNTQLDATQGATGGVPRTLISKLNDVLTANDFAGIADGVHDDAAALQSLINLNRREVDGAGRTYLVGTSLYLPNDKQSLVNCRLIAATGMTSPLIYAGATSSVGGVPSGAICGLRLSHIDLLGPSDGQVAGSRIAGSRGLKLISCTESIFEAVRAWFFEAGIEIGGFSLVNQFIGPDLRSNRWGFYDPTGNISTNSWEGGSVFGGRIEGNDEQGIIVATPNVGFHGTIIEGNGATATAAEVQVKAGTGAGAVEFHGCYMESTAGNASDCMIEVAASSSRFIKVVGGQYYGNAASTRFLVHDKSASTTRSHSFDGVLMYTCLNWLKSDNALANNSIFSVIGGYTDASINPVNASYVTFSGGATYLVFDRVNGLQTNAPAVMAGTFTTDTLKSTNASSALSLYSATTKHIRQRMGSAATSFADLIAASELAASTSYVFEISGGARNGAADGRHFKAQIQVSCDASAVPTVVDTEVITKSAATNAPTFAKNGTDSGIDVTGLNNLQWAFNIWKFQL